MRTLKMLVALCVAAVLLPVASAIGKPTTLTLATAGLGALQAGTAFQGEGYLELRYPGNEPFCHDAVAGTILTNGDAKDQATITGWGLQGSCTRFGAMTLTGEPFNVELTGKETAALRAGAGKITVTLNSECVYEAKKLRGAISGLLVPGAADLFFAGTGKLNKKVSSTGCPQKPEIALEDMLYAGADELVLANYAK